MTRVLLVLIFVGLASANSNFMINSWNTQASVAPSDQLLLEDPVSGSLKRANPSALSDDVFYLRLKTDQNVHGFYEGYPKSEFFEKAYAFKMEAGTQSQWVRTKFYRTIKSQAFRDEEEVYFDKGFIYSAYVPTLYFKRDGKWESINSTASKPGALLIQSIPTGVEVYHRGVLLGKTPLRTQGYEAGVISLTLKHPKLADRTHLFQIKAGELNHLKVQMLDIQAPGESKISTQQYDLPKSKLVDPYYTQLNLVNKELQKVMAQIDTLKVVFDSVYGSAPRPAPKSIDEWQDIEYLNYKEEYLQTQKAAYMAFTEKLQDRLSYLTATRVSLKSSIQAIEAQVLDVMLQPQAFKWKLLDSAKSQYAFKFKFQSNSLGHDFMYKGTATLTTTQKDSLIQLLESKDTTQIKFNIQYQNKAARIPSQGKILKRYYRYQEFKLLQNNLAVALVGQFELAPYIKEFPEVFAWLNADELLLQERQAIAEAQAKLLAQKRREIEAAQYQDLLNQLRGEVIELDSGVFYYSRKNVTMSAFGVNSTEITQEHYERLTGKNPSSFKNPKKPVHNVSFNQARKFCKTAGGDLPTQAQWEYAARAGSNGYFFWGERSKDATPYAIYAENSLNEGIHSPTYGPQTVGSKRPNPWGLYDVAGNVSEWTLDFDGLFAFQIYVSSKDPTGLNNTLGIWHERIFKGGSWRDAKKLMEHTKSDYEDPRFWGDMIGFRCVYPAHQIVPKDTIVKIISKHQKNNDAKKTEEIIEIKKDTLDTTAPKVQPKPSPEVKPTKPEDANSKKEAEVPVKASKSTSTANSTKAPATSTQVPATAPAPAPVPAAAPTKAPSPPEVKPVEIPAGVAPTPKKQ